MTEIVASAILTAAAALGCVRLGELFKGRPKATPFGRVSTTVGVTVFLTAAGRMFERGGLAAAGLLLLLAWLVHDIVRRHHPSERIVSICTWLSLGMLVSSIALERG
ncbi:hypothetical protein [Methylobacterium gregans]|uniref:hypothetical protein n=1 Tax=Methylobacterium gregans TaxID=374424 RepID=UPI001EE1D537|nr:hypothetical protein [Methylobacterium gregans]MDQ0521270.1 multisubunit Na+/H+ antiporter MnhG subunit [Methylobacterium gregans]GLS54433.1 hypothetical protein GCM10007886_26160 [Methylobacterium gregans]